MADAQVPAIQVSKKVESLHWHGKSQHQISCGCGSIY